jgi:hypothetical protein
MDRRWTRIRAKNRALLLALLGLVALFYLVAIVRMGGW